jgi:hypothetical protein
MPINLKTFAILLLVPLGMLGMLSPQANEPVEDAQFFLSFEMESDGRCHNLSEGGKLAVLHNSHPTKNINFRLTRYFVDVRQSGRATGIAAPTAEPVKIGCTMVGGRPQRWVVDRAEFATADAR